MNSNKNAFTLVELIIVITILAILATIAFVSFQNYVKDSRDSNRLTTMKNIETGLELFGVQSGTFPAPDNYYEIQASGSTMLYQGIIGDSIAKRLKTNKIPVDPYDKSPFLYSTNVSKGKYKLLGYMENKTVYYTPTYAQNYINKSPKVLGHDIGILLNQDKSPLNNNIDILKGSSGTLFTSYFKNGIISASGNQLITFLAIHDPTLSNFDENLVGYWDMESTIMTGGINKLKDLSKYENHGIMGTGISFIPGIKNGQAINFKGRKSGSYIDLGNNSILTPRNFTLSTWLYAPNILNSDCYNYIYSNSRDILSMTGIDIKIYCGNQMSFKVSNSGGGGELTYNGFNSSSWKFLTWSYNGNTLSFYINGKIVHSVNSGYDIGNNIASYNTYIGAMGFNPGEYELNGTLDDFRIYNKAFSSNDILTLYNSY